MFLVVFVLHDPEKLDDLLTAWEATGVSGVTILPSSGLGRMRQADAMRDELPMMPSLDDFLRREPHLSRTLFSLVDAQAGVDALVAATRWDARASVPCCPFPSASPGSSGPVST